jgi:hypothetical protein
MFKKLKNIRLRPLLSHILVTLAYPAAKAVTAANNRLQVFTDAVTIIALILIIGGVIYSMVLHGDYDLSGYVFNRGIGKEQKKKDYGTYKKDRKQRREEAFNYPLFLGFVYLLASVCVAYLIL